MSEGEYLPMCLDAAVPLWIQRFKLLSAAERQVRMRELDASDLCFRMEYLMHRGPKEGDSAKAFNDLAQAIALMSFCPGGITVFGRTWKAARERLKL